MGGGGGVMWVAGPICAYRLERESVCWCVFVRKCATRHCLSKVTEDQHLSVCVCVEWVVVVVVLVVLVVVVVVVVRVIVHALCVGQGYCLCGGSVWDTYVCLCVCVLAS